MFDIHTVSGALTAFVAGLATSPHCVGMCGPIGCAVIPAGKGEDHGAALALYHCCRAIAYMLLGALMGALGNGVVDLLQSSPARFLPWVLVAVLVAIGLRLDRYLPKPAAWSRYYARWQLRLRQLPAPLLGAGLGFLTPLLPCGPLYLILTLCLFSGSALLGAELAIGFALGTIPLLWLAQAGFLRARHKISPTVLMWVQRVIALSAAGIIAWRMIASEGKFGEWLCH